MNKTERIATKLAGALLLQYGELSVESIYAMPFLSKSNEAEIVIRRLLDLFDAEIHTRMVSTYPILEWEDVIRLKVPKNHQCVAG